MAEYSLRDLVDSSGFPLQRAIEHQVNATTSQHGWKVESPEHAWEHPVSGENGFIDIVLSHENSIYEVVIECKRPRNGQWIFLLNPESKETCRLTSRWIAGPTETLEGWRDFFIEPPSFESDVCIVRGTGEKGPTMIERLTGALTDSIFALSKQEALHMRRQAYRGTHAKVYIPMVVTIARLMACRLDPGKVSLLDGLSTDLKFDEVPLIRFHKSMTTRLPKGAAPTDLQSENRYKERSVLIVNARSIVDVLGKIRLQRGKASRIALERAYPSKDRLGARSLEK